MCSYVYFLSTYDYFFNFRIDIEVCNSVGRTALHIAAGYGKFKVIQLLIEAGANPYALDNRGQTPSLVASNNKMMECVRCLNTVGMRMQIHNPETVTRLKIKAYKDLQRRVKKGEKTRKSTKKRISSNIEFSAVATEKSNTVRPRYNSESHIAPRHHSKKISKQMSDLTNFVLRPANSADQLAEKQELDTNSLREDSTSDHVPSEGQTLPASFKPLKTNTSGMLESLNSLPDNIPRKKKSTSSMISGQFENPTRRISTASEAPANLHMGRSVSVSSRMSTATYSGYPQPVLTENDSPLTTFLQSLDITEIAQKLFDEKMDLDSLLLCEENDFSGIGLPLGPRKKLLAAIKTRRDTLTNPGKIRDTSL